MKHKGFTLIELVVIISIFAIMAAVALFNFTGFQDNVGISNLASDIALTIRQAQVEGGETLGAGIGNAIILDPTTNKPEEYAEGVHFGQTAGVFDKFFILYTKTNPTDTLNFNSSADTITDTINIQGLDHIDGIYYSANLNDLAIDPTTGQPSSGATAIPDLSIAFTRPNPEAIMFNGTTPLTSDYVGIYLAADANCTSTGCKDSHVVLISPSGEIEVQ